MMIVPDNICCCWPEFRCLCNAYSVLQDIVSSCLCHFA